MFIIPFYDNAADGASKKSGNLIIHTTSRLIMINKDAKLIAVLTLT